MIRLRAAVPGFGLFEPVCGSVGPFDLEVSAGSALALIGPNGAGKSLLLSLVAGVARPVSGSVEVVGRVGYAPSMLAESPAVRCDELLEFVAGGAGLLGRARREAVGRGLQMAGLSEHPGMRVDRLSDGRRKRLLIATALVSDPDVIVLDDPLQSLDPAGRREVEQLVGDAVLAGRCVLAALNDAQIGACWTDVAVMHSGRITRTLPAAGPWSGSSPPRGEDLLGN
jgi:ABC-2 type transport system ATP-binding protein